MKNSIVSPGAVTKLENDISGLSEQIATLIATQDLSSQITNIATGISNAFLYKSGNSVNGRLYGRTIPTALGTRLCTLPVKPKIQITVPVFNIATNALLGTAYITTIGSVEINSNASLTSGDFGDITFNFVTD